jgi:hypothetical protein
MMKRLLLLMWLLATFINSDLISQSKEELRNNFYEAESWILFEAYQDALPLYQQLAKKYPDNSNFKYRIGLCYMNIPGEKIKAIKYLEDAIKNIDPKYKEDKFNETGAPYDALYYLANAYRINNQIDNALRAYELFRKNLNPAIYDSTIVDLQIQSCRNAKELMRKPLFIKQKNLGSVINSSSNDFNPVVSDKEDLLVFSRSQAFYDAILYSTKVNGVWTEPMNMNELLKVDRDLFPTSISKDGKELYLYSSADYDGIIYTTKFENGIWSPLVKLNDNINTKYWESHATVSHDNKKLYFTSNRKGSIGGLDIYVSSRDSTGDWGPAVNLGPVINTPYNEESPFLSEDDKTLFFSSRGHFNMGGYDVFYSTMLPNGEWSVPLNVGYPFNSTDDDLFFKPINQGYEGYMAKEIPGGFGKQDIYRIEIFSNDHPRKFLVRGNVKVADLINNMNDSVKISAMNIKNPNQTIKVYSNPSTGEYEFQLPQGDYQFTYEGSGGEKAVKNIDLPLLHPSDSILLPRTILPKTDFVADLNIETNKTISVTTGDSIVFPMKVEPKSILTVEHWVGDSLISVEHFNMTDSTFNYKMAPSKGNNRVVFKLTDKFNNTTKTEVLVTWANKIINQPLEHPEYSRIISQKQIASLASMLRSRANDSLLTVISETNTDNKQFGKVDDYISLLKEEAAKKGIGPEEIDKLALKVAVMDNILSQAAVDYLAKHTEGELKTILSNTDIYVSDLKTWKDLQSYIDKQTAGKVTPDELNRIAAAILAETDPAIGILKRQILNFSENSPEGDLVRQIVASLDQRNITTKEQWLQEFYRTAIDRGLTQQQISELLVKISSSPGTKVEEYLRDLIAQSDEPLASLLKLIDLKKENITTPEELISYLFANKEKYPLEALSRSIAKLIAARNLSAEGLKSQPPAVGKGNLKWILVIVLGAGIAGLLFFLWWRRRKKNI